MAKRTTLENRFYELFLEFFAHAEACRRWNVFEDIPWHQATKTPDPEVTSLVETYYAVELYLPDYVRHVLGIEAKPQSWRVSVPTRTRFKSCAQRAPCPTSWK